MQRKALGRETVSAIAKRYKAIAAINGGFFKSGEWVDGLPAGILKIRAMVWHSFTALEALLVGQLNFMQRWLIAFKQKQMSF